MTDARKAFRGPSTWPERKGTQWQHRGCSTPGCTAVAYWMIARHSFDRGSVRYACHMCKAMKYASLPEVELNAEIAQSAEHLTASQDVAGSSPALRSRNGLVCSNEKRRSPGGRTALVKRGSGSCPDSQEVNARVE